MKHFYITVIGILTLFSCSNDIYKVSERNYRKTAKELGKSLKVIEAQSINNEQANIIESQNFSLRKPNYIVIHHTAQDSCEQTYRTFALDRTQVSSHYVICEDGTITQMLNDYLRGWHAGKGSWKNITDLNSISLGIELDNNGDEVFAQAQIESLLNLLTHLTEEYEIPKENIIGHADLAPGRKVDPNKYFPWKRLSEEGFGIWYDEDLLETTLVPEHFDTELALKFIGYNTTNLENAIQSFKLHFNSLDEKLRELTEKDKKILFLLMQ